MIVKKNEIAHAVTVADLEAGDLFSYKNKIWMKVKPIGFLSNSSVINDVLARGDSIAVSLEDGEVAAWTRKAVCFTVKGHFVETT